MALKVNDKATPGRSILKDDSWALSQFSTIWVQGKISRLDTFFKSNHPGVAGVRLFKWTCSAPPDRRSCHEGIASTFTKSVNVPVCKQRHLCLPAQQGPAVWMPTNAELVHRCTYYGHHDKRKDEQYLSKGHYSLVVSSHFNFCNTCLCILIDLSLVSEEKGCSHTSSECH